MMYLECKDGGMQLCGILNSPRLQAQKKGFSRRSLGGDMTRLPEPIPS